MNITLINRDPRRYYECFDCGLDISVRRQFEQCPNCHAIEQFHRMD